MKVYVDTTSAVSTKVNYNTFDQVQRNKVIYLDDNTATSPYYEMIGNEITNFGGAGMMYGLYMEDVENYKITDNNISSSVASTYGLRGIRINADDFSNNTLEAAITHVWLSGGSSELTAINCSFDASSLTLSNAGDII